ncbi:hypothetical protein C8J56DRAFT_1037769 [Mycena floridula]|nr:hypothetical protein C8J56DRAFT_1037769 [Mycena floridula]
MPQAHSRKSIPRFQPYRPSLTMEANWGPERLLPHTGPPLAVDRVYPMPPLPRRKRSVVVCVPAKSNDADLPATAAGGASRTPAPHRTGYPLLIPKPPGEAGRPGPKGYKLSTALDMNNYKEVHAYIKSLVHQYLVTDKPITQQKPVKLEQLFHRSLRRYPQLDEYQDNWALRDFVTTILHNCKKTAEAPTTRPRVRFQPERAARLSASSGSAMSSISTSSSRSEHTRR